MNDAIVLAIEVLFAIIFVRALLDYVAKRDPLSRDVVLVFSATATLFLLDIAARTEASLGLGALPPAVRLTAIALLLAQPLLTLRLASRLGPVRHTILVSAFAAYLFSTGVLVALGLAGETIDPLFGLGVAGVFALTELIAAQLLLAHRQRRTGAARMRLLLAAVSSIMFAAALFMAGLGSAGGATTAGAGAIASHLIALGAAIGYLLAFFPPAVLRRNWQAVTAYRFSQDLLDIDPLTTVEELWARFALASAAITGSEGAIVLGGKPGEWTQTAAVWVEPESEALFDHSDLARLEATLFEPSHGARIYKSGARLLNRVGPYYATVVPIEDGEKVGAVMYLSRYQSLFSNDDRDILTSLAHETALLVERRVILAEQQRLATELEVSSDAVRRASQAKSDFLSSMSHELRTPLTAIIGFSDLMRSEPKRDHHTTVPDEWIEHIHKSGNHLLTLVNDVLDLAKVESGRLELDRQPFDLRAAINESIAGLAPLAEKKSLRLSTDIAAGQLVADRGRFRQILYNLLSNAIKYTHDSGEIRVVAALSDGWVSIAVDDTGIGISTEDLPRLFEEFRQLGDPGTHEPGTGLGLALTRRLVEAHGGHLDVTSQIHEGSTFTVWLPQGVQAVTQVQPSKLPADGVGAGRDVLIVEDEPSAAQLLRTYLEAEGYRVRIAPEGEAALAEVRRLLPGAIILDVMLPGMDGWEVLRRLKSDPDTREVPVIIATVMEEREMGLALGAVDYLVKPLARQALLDRLTRYAPQARTRGATMRVLAVDDDPGTLAVISATLEPEGYEVLAAPSGAEGLKLAYKHRPDFVICDLLMPDIDGFALVAALKADRRVRDIPILVLTAHDLSKADRERLNGSILGVVSKGDDGMIGLREWLSRITPQEGTPT